MRTFSAAILLCVAIAMCGCVDRKVTVTTSPPGAEVYIGGRFAGTSPATVEFTHYGKHTLLIRMVGYEPVKGELEVKRPLHQTPGLDFFSENVYPGTVTDEHSAHFDLTKAEVTSMEEAKQEFERARVDYQQMLEEHERE